MKRCITYTPVGIIHSEHTVPEKTPIQPIYASGCKGTVDVFPEYAEGLKNLEGFSHIYLLYHLDRVNEVRLKTSPFLQNAEHGIFATRAPWRPNPIGMSIVRLTRREGNVLYIEGVDVLDGTPLLDIKPYTARFDHIQTDRDGWLDEIDEPAAQTRGKRDFK
jgi:tRNA-Thr(GGU) m(6)t(6)A37 methyltransferase TsaA